MSDSTDTSIQVDENTHISECFSTAVHNSGIVISLNALEDARVKGDAPTKVTIKEPKDGKTNASKVQLASWGSDNLWPQNRKEAIKKHTEFAPLLEKKVAFLMGIGVFPVKITGFQNNTLQYEIAKDEAPEAYKFLTSRKFLRWFLEASVDYAYFKNIFPELILNPDRKSIDAIAHQEATQSRLSVQTDKGEIKWCVLNANWEQYNEKYTKRLPVIDNRKTKDVQLVKKQLGKFHYIYVGNYPSPGDGYYQTPSHEGYFLSEWYDVAMAIPKFKKYLMKNQMSLKYHIEIDTEYWEHRYPKWKSFDFKKKKETVAAEMKAFSDQVTGEDKGGMAVTSVMKWVQSHNVHRPFWKINVLKKEKVDGEYIEDSREASMHLQRSLGLDPAIVGAGPGRDNATAGSGSDKWAAIKIYLATLWPERQALLDVIFFIFEYNGWDKDGVFPMIIDHPLFSTATASDKMNTGPLSGAEAQGENKPNPEP